MVKLKAITRTDKDYERETKFDMYKVTRTHQRNQHQFSQAREYQRAVVASKISKIFAKPFLYALNNHSDGISCFGKIRNNIEKICSGSFSGEVFVWDLLGRKPYFKIQAFEGGVKGISFSNDGQFLVTVGDNNMAKLYNTKQCRKDYINHQKILSSEKYITQSNVSCVDFSYKEQKFVTSGEKVELWDITKSVPIEQFDWGFDTILAAKINPVQHNLILCTALDRGVYIHDMRSRSNLAKTLLTNKSSCVDWNPMEPFNFICGNEDSNIYAFDIRKMDIVKNIHKDHIGAVMTVDYSPTGKEFVSGSFDKTVKIFEVTKGFSRETYHGKRMQKVFSVMWSLDNNYIFSGSEDTNIRVWKAVSDRKVGELSQREQNARNYRDALLSKFKHTDEIRKIKKTHLPKYILNAKKKKQIQKESHFKKVENMRINNEEIFEEPLPEKEKKIVKTEQLNQLIYLMGDVCSKSQPKKDIQKSFKKEKEEFKFEPFDIEIGAKIMEQQFEVKYNRKKNELYLKSKELADQIPQLRGSQDHQYVFDEMSEIIKIKNSCVALNKCTKYAKIVKERSKKLALELNNKNYQELYQFDKTFQGLFKARDYYGQTEFQKFNEFIQHLDSHILNRWKEEEKLDHHIKQAFNQKQPDVIEVKQELDDFLVRFSIVLKDYQPNYQNNNQNDGEEQLQRKKTFDTMKAFDKKIEEIIDNTNKIQKRQSYGHIQITESENQFIQKQKQRKSSKKEEEIAKKFTQNMDTIKIDLGPIEEQQSSSDSENLLDF